MSLAGHIGRRRVQRVHLCVRPDRLGQDAHRAHPLAEPPQTKQHTQNNEHRTTHSVGSRRTVRNADRQHVLACACVRACVRPHAPWVNESAIRRARVKAPTWLQMEGPEGDRGVNYRALNELFAVCCAIAFPAGSLVSVLRVLSRHAVRFGAQHGMRVCIQERHFTASCVRQHTAVSESVPSSQAGRRAVRCAGVRSTQGGV